jgi:pyruvate dehydrogenase E2 component (dihydrolipoamide acetyltransferase)
MTVEVIVPDVGEVGMEVTFVRWVRNEGDEVHEDDALFELDTAKAIIEVQAFASGRLTGLQVAAGDIVLPHQVVARLETETEPASDNAVETPDLALPTAPSDGPAPVAIDSDPAMPTGSPARSVGVATTSSRRARNASPRARQLARELGVDLATIMGTGSDGMVTERDVRVSEGGDPTASASARVDSSTGDQVVTVRPSVEAVERVRLAVARRTLESWQAIPHVSLRLEADVTDGLRVRRPTTLVAYAAVRALLEQPQCNLGWDADRTVRRDSVDLGILVDTPIGLLLPAVRNAGRLTPDELAAAIRSASERARSGQLALEDAGAHSVTISNLGMFSVDEFSGVIPSPDVLLLAVGRVRTVPRWNGETLERREVVTLTLTIDHRALSGADGARLLTTLEGMLDPSRESR